MVIDLLNAQDAEGNGATNTEPPPESSDNTEPPPESNFGCSFAGPYLVCEYGFTLAGSQEGTGAQVNFQAQCDASSNSGFDYRRSQNCQCSAVVSDLTNGLEKTCPCSVCAVEFGDSPITVDCRGASEDPYIIDDCSILDCNGACMNPDALTASPTDGPPVSPPGGQPAGNVYTSGSTTVTVSEQTIDANNSNRKCVKYTSGAPERYDTACFTTAYSDGGTFIQCSVDFDDGPCTSCTPCETDASEVGYILDCFNVQPSVGTQGLCVMLTDENVQEILVYETFESQPFAWSTGPGNAPVDAPAPANPPSVDSVTTSPTPFCFDNLVDVHEFVEAKAFSTVETVILCPNTIFDVDLQMALYPRSNTRYLCGADGLSSNDCRLTGGSYQLLSSARLFNFEDTIGVLVQGLTFDNSRVAGAVLSNAGDVTFIDCIFEKHRGRMAVSMLYIPLPKGRRRLEGLGDGFVSFERKLDEINSYYTSLLINATAWGNLLSNTEAEPSSRRNQQTSRQFVSFERCLFQSNTANSNKFIPNSGVIAVKSAFNDLAIDSCRFVDNDTGEPSSSLVRRPV